MLMQTQMTESVSEAILSQIAEVAEYPERFTAENIEWAKYWINSLRMKKGLPYLQDYPELMKFMANY